MSRDVARRVLVTAAALYWLALMGVVAVSLRGCMSQPAPAATASPVTPSDPYAPMPEVVDFDVEGTCTVTVSQAGQTASSVLEADRLEGQIRGRLPATISAPGCTIRMDGATLQDHLEW